MALDRTFAAAYIDNGVRHRIFGRRLKPFCLWHLLLLQVLDSPFVSNGNVTLFDLKTAVGICRLGYRQSNIHRPIFPLFLNLESLKKHVGRFLTYVQDYLSKPEYSIVPYDTRGGGPPPPLITPPPHIVATAFHASHGARISVGEAWEMPIGEAYISEAMFFRMIKDAQVDFFDDEEKKFQEDMRKAGLG